MRKVFSIFFLSRVMLLIGMISVSLPVAGQRFGGGNQVEPAGIGELDALTYRYIGPVGNRVSAVSGVPGDANIYYIGAASGGIFRSRDGGTNWEPIFDDQPVAAIGSLAVDPVNTNVIWAGTGETFIRSNVLTGNGIYKSVDGGDTWQQLGLEKTGRIGRIVVDPLDPDTVFVAAMGHAYGPQQERGVYRTQDGGKTWEQVLFVDNNTGAADVVMDPNNPNILFAGMWPLLIRTWGRTSGGPGGSLWMSTDGGDTWKNLTGIRGLPAGPYGKIGLGMTAADSDRVYALIELSSNGLIAPVDPGHGTLYRSDNGGDSWRMVSANHDLMQRPLYYTRLAVAPDDPDELHTMSTRHSHSIDGGSTWSGGGAGGDNHDMWIDPIIPNRLVVGNDGGVSISTTRGESWARPRMPIAQVYHVFVDDKIPYNVMGNRQDGPSTFGPSNSRTGGNIPIGEWHSVGGCESGFAVPAGDHTIWSGCYDGILDVYDTRTGHSRNVSPWPDNPEGWSAGQLRYRFQWTFPIHVSPHDPNKVFVGSQVVHKTTNQGLTWDVISPDLSTGDPSLVLKTGGLTFDDTSPTYAAVLFAIAESPLQEDLIWAGTNDGMVQVTRDGGNNWTNVSANMPELPALSTVSNIEPSNHATGTAYVAIDTHQIGIFEPFLYKTTNFGSSWTRIDGHSGTPEMGVGLDYEATVNPGGIPAGPLAYTHVIREDPHTPGLLFAGTANAVYVSFDDGDTWESLQSTLPHAPVHWLTIQPHFNDLVIGTYGRGFWIMDDITPLQQMTDVIRSSDVHLFEPRNTYRFHSVGSPMSGQDPAAGRNPDPGASISYWLSKEMSGAADQGEVDEPGETQEMGIPGNTGTLNEEMDPSGGRNRRTRVTIEILNDNGEVVRTIRNAPARPGLNRTYWNMRYESSARAVMRTKPLGHPHVELNENGTRNPGDGRPITPMAPPGIYTLQLKVNNEPPQEQPLTLLMDPASMGSETEINEQLQMMLELRDNQNDIAGMLNEAEIVRSQLYELRTLLRNHDDFSEINNQITALDEKIIGLEMNLTDLRLVGGQDTLRYPRQLYAKIASLSGYISGHDFAPAEAHRTVHEMYKENIGTYMTQMKGIREGDLAAFNRMLQEKGIGTVITGKEGGN
jgi:photosystem II stability/assembly factor-like uncharacterized protein